MNGAGSLRAHALSGGDVERLLLFVEVPLEAVFFCEATESLAPRLAVGESARPMGGGQHLQSSQSLAVFPSPQELGDRVAGLILSQRTESPTGTLDISLHARAMR